MQNKLAKIFSKSIKGIYNMSNIEERVKKIIIEQLGVKEEEVKSEASFVDDLGADSLDTVELVMAITNSTVSKESAPKSSTNDASDFTSSSFTPSCSMMIFFTRSSMLLMLYIPLIDLEKIFASLFCKIN